MAAVGEVIRLVARGGEGAASVFGLEYAGQTWDDSMDGNPVGQRRVERVQAANGTFTLTVQPISAVMLTVRVQNEIMRE